MDPVLHGVGMPGGGISTTEAAEEVEVLAMGMELTSRALIRRGRRRPRTLLGHTKAVTRLVFRPSDGAFICSCARDSTLRLWHVRHRRHHESYQGSCFLPIVFMGLEKTTPAVLKKENLSIFLFPLPTFPSNVFFHSFFGLLCYMIMITHIPQFGVSGTWAGLATLTRWRGHPTAAPSRWAVPLN